ncbi:hypothetical protein BH24ACI4_BH24ACI4_25970 [soil metagenome]
MSMRRNGQAALVAGATILGGWTLAIAQGNDSAQAPTFRSGVELVTVDAGVVDRQGRPVRDLDAGDFVVTVGGQRRRVASAEFIDTSTPRASPAQESAPPPVSTNDGAGLGRQFVFIVDQNTLEPGSLRNIGKAASTFFGGLSFADRSALILMPTGAGMPLTWAHDKVQDALARITGTAHFGGSNEFSSLSEARDIATRNVMALRNVAQRECGDMMASSGPPADPFGSGGSGAGTQGGGPVGAPTPSAGGGTQGGDTQGGDTQAPGTPSGGGQTTGGSSPQPRGRQSTGTSRIDSCTRDIQTRAEWAWRTAHMTSLASLNALHHVLAALGRIPGDKTVILISGGWPLDDRDQTSLLASVAADAAAARATLYTLFVPASVSSAGMRMVSSTPSSDRQLHSSPLEMLASMTGGGSHRVEVGAEGIFARLSTELSGYYRLGVEKDPADADGKPRRVKIQVSRNAVTVRSRELFDTRTFEDRNWAARLASALDAPIPAGAIGLKVTSYVTAHEEEAGRFRLVLAGEATRVDPGEATFKIVVRDFDGKEVLAGEQPLGEPTGDGLWFATSIPLPAGRYVVRVAVIDGAGRVGSVDHRAEARFVKVGGMEASGPLLVRVPAGQTGNPRVALREVRQDERLALQVDLEGDGAGLTDAGVMFDISPAGGGAPLIEAPASLAPGSRSGWMMAQAVTDLRVLPPGEYVLRSRVTSGGDGTVEMSRTFAVLEAPAETAHVATAGSPAAGGTSNLRSAIAVIAPLPGFAMDQVLAPEVRGAFLDRVAARPDASSPMLRELIDRARSGGIEDLFISDVLAAESPVAAFLKGLSLLAQQKLEPAAQAFRSAMRGAADFYPAMVYLGACYAAGGNDKEAAGAWRTALIKEADSPALHLVLGEALLRQGSGDLARETLEAAQIRWPGDDALKRRFAVAALLTGDHASGLRALDDLVAMQGDDEASLGAGLLVLYEAFVNKRPVEDPERDRARMTRLAEAYKARGGASQALVDSWLATTRGSD